MISNEVDARILYCSVLSLLPPNKQKEELKQFFIDMMDYTEQTDIEDVYIDLHKFLENNQKSRDNINAET